MTLLSAACTAENPTHFGDEGQKCYPNGTCNAGLVCIADVVCVRSQPDLTAVDLSSSVDMTLLEDLAHLDDLATSLADLTAADLEVTQNADLKPTPIVVATATPVDQPIGGSPTYALLAGIGLVLEGTGSSDPGGMSLSFAWKVVSVPSGSAITNASLATATTATSGFVPDLGGDYTIELALSTPDSREAKKQFTISVRTAPLFFLNIEVGDMLSAGQTLSSIRSDGTGKRALGCAAFANTPLAGGEDPALFNAFFALSSYRVGYGTPDPVTGIEPPARVIAGQLIPTDMEGVGNFQLFVAEEDSECATKAPRAVPNDVAGIPLAPVWSPDRSRFLYSVIRKSDEEVGLSVATNTETTPVTGLGSLALARLQPAWIDDSNIMFLVREGTGPYTYKFFIGKLSGASGNIVSDVALWADCTAESSNWLAMQGLEYRNGSAFVGVSSTDKNFYGFNVLKITPPTGTTTCNATNLTQAASSSSARDFAISPDGKWLVFAKPEIDNIDMTTKSDGTPALDLHIMEIQTGVVRKLIGEAGTVEYGPQFIAGGRQIMYSVGPSSSAFSSDTDMRGSTVSWKGISVVNLDGSNARSLLGGVAKFSPTDGAPVTFFGPMIGANYFPFGGCGIDPLQSPLSALTTGLVFALAVLVGLRRRRN